MSIIESKKNAMYRVGVIEFFACVCFFSSVFADNRINVLLWPDGCPDNPIVHNREETTVNRDAEQNEFGLTVVQAVL